MSERGTSRAAPPTALLVFDGGDSPGYMAVATALVEEATARGWKVYAAREGFRSLAGDELSEGPSLVRLVWHEEDAWRVHRRDHPATALHRRIADPGCEFRAERFADFPERKNLLAAARFIEDGGFQYVIGVGGNGTSAGIKAIADLVEGNGAARFGFVNVSVDSDLVGDRAVGFATGVEEGAAIARGLYEDAFTHNRIYIIEMMGRDSGKHALHVGVSARAHLILLPDFELCDDIVRDVARALDRHPYALVVVAEAFMREKGEQSGAANSAEFVRGWLCDAGLCDREERRVIAEPYSRYLRGVRPCALDIEMAVFKSTMLVDALAEGHDRVMPYFLSEHTHGLMPFASFETDNSVEEAFLGFVDRLGVVSLRDMLSRSRGWGASSRSARIG